MRRAARAALWVSTPMIPGAMVGAYEVLANQTVTVEVSEPPTEEVVRQRYLDLASDDCTRKVLRVLFAADPGGDDPAPAGSEVATRAALNELCRDESGRLGYDPGLPRRASEQYRAAQQTEVSLDSTPSVSSADFAQNHAASMVIVVLGWAISAIVWSAHSDKREPLPPSNHMEV